MGANRHATACAVTDGGEAIEITLHTGRTPREPAQGERAVFEAAEGIERESMNWTIGEILFALALSATVCAVIYWYHLQIL